MLLEKNIGRLSFGVLRVVREVMLQGSVSVAAERLDITQPAVTQNLQRFEMLTGISVPAISVSVGSPVLEDIRDSVFQAVANMEDLFRVAQREAQNLPRLGLGDCLGVYFGANESFYDILAKTYLIHIARPSELADLFSRGELDIVARPLFHYDRDCEIATDFSVTWVKPISDTRSSAGSVVDAQKTIRLIPRSRSCPYSHYIDKRLREHRGDIEISGRVDNYHVAMRFAQMTNAYFAVPVYLTSVFQSQAPLLPALNELNVSVRFGVMYNSKRLSLSSAMDVFDLLETVLI